MTGRRLQRPGTYLALAVAAVGSLCAAVALTSARPALAQAEADLPNGGIHTLSKDEGRIRALLEGAGWVSPGLSKTRFIYMVSFRSCPDCIRYETTQFPDLHKAGFDTRVIMVARRNRSSVAERASVGELWATRSWKTFEAWTSVPVDAWTAQGLKSGDTDANRVALVERGRALVDQLQPLLAENGVSFAYPTLIWQDRSGHLRGCACEEAKTYPFIRAELGLPVQ